jgi:hypothetical protein
MIAKRVNHLKASQKTIGTKSPGECVQSGVTDWRGLSTTAVRIAQNPAQSKGVIAGTTIQIKHPPTETRSSRQNQESVVVESREETITFCRMAKKLNLQESRVVISCLYSLTACRPVEF